MESSSSFIDLPNQLCLAPGSLVLVGVGAQAAPAQLHCMGSSACCINTVSAVSLNAKACLKVILTFSCVILGKERKGGENGRKKGEKRGREGKGKGKGRKGREREGREMGRIENPIVQTMSFLQIDRSHTKTTDLLCLFCDKYLHTHVCLHIYCFSYWLDLRIVFGSNMLHISSSSVP